ncbi:hypothetical protein CEXT_59181 [Caerostris extrusa]|uniref:Uncharacterized protein n=1 Tax=Caerostris extrusa TaxID=172846 RepID=A0AAV4U5H3_CAEEX|nr:hypothetical protein CEXT_59181 [Caerostris extrusa]
MNEEYKLYLCANILNWLISNRFEIPEKGNKRYPKSYFAQNSTPLILLSKKNHVERETRTPQGFNQPGGIDRGTEAAKEEALKSSDKDKSRVHAMPTSNTRLKQWQRLTDQLSNNKG